MHLVLCREASGTKNCAWKCNELSLQQSHSVPSTGREFTKDLVWRVQAGRREQCFKNCNEHLPKDCLDALLTVLQSNVPAHASASASSDADQRMPAVAALPDGSDSVSSP